MCNKSYMAGIISPTNPDWYRVDVSKNLCATKVTLVFFVVTPLPGKGTSMYYVSTKGGGRGSAKCLHLLMGREQEVRLM